MIDDETEEEFETEEEEEAEDGSEPEEEGSSDETVPCPKCKAKIPVTSEKRPLEVKCPKCGKKVWLKKDAQPGKPLRKLRVIAKK